MSEFGPHLETADLTIKDSQTSSVASVERTNSTQSNNPDQQSEKATQTDALSAEQEQIQTKVLRELMALLKQEAYSASGEAPFFQNLPKFKALVESVSLTPELQAQANQVISSYIVENKRVINWFDSDEGKGKLDPILELFQLKLTDLVSLPQIKEQFDSNFCQLLEMNGGNYNPKSLIELFGLTPENQEFLQNYFDQFTALDESSQYQRCTDIARVLETFQPYLLPQSLDLARGLLRNNFSLAYVFSHLDTFQNLTFCDAVIFVIKEVNKNNSRDLMGSLEEQLNNAPKNSLGEADLQAIRSIDLGIVLRHSDLFSGFSLDQNFINSLDLNDELIVNSLYSNLNYLPDHSLSIDAALRILAKRKRYSGNDYIANLLAHQEKFVHSFDQNFIDTIINGKDDELIAQLLKHLDKLPMLESMAAFDLIEKGYTAEVLANSHRFHGLELNNDIAEWVVGGEKTEDYLALAQYIDKFDDHSLSATITDKLLLSPTNFGNAWYQLRPRPFFAVLDHQEKFTISPQNTLILNLISTHRQEISPYETILFKTLHDSSEDKIEDTLNVFINLISKLKSPDFSPSNFVINTDERQAWDSFPEFVKSESTRKLDFSPKLKNITDIDSLRATKENILDLLGFFIHQDANDWEVNDSSSPQLREKIKTLFQENETKNLALNTLIEKWQAYLNGQDAQDFPAVLELFARHNRNNDGAGPLTQIEAFLDYCLSYQQGLQRSENQNGLFSQTKTIEDRFGREHWGNSEVSQFYAISAEVMSASPDLYKDFIEFFNQVPSKKDFAQFITQIYPLYRAQLTLLKRHKYSGDNVGHGHSTADYSHLDIGIMRTNLRATLDIFHHDDSSVEEPPPDLPKNRGRILSKIKTIFKGKFGASETTIPEESTTDQLRSVEENPSALPRIRERILDEIKTIFKEKFGILETAIPKEFTDDHLRSMENIVLYLSNIANRGDQKETLLGFYLALLLDGPKGNTSWDTLRRGESIDPSKYLEPGKAQVVADILQKKVQTNLLTMQNLSLTAENLPAFMAAFQEETTSQRLSDVQTIDLKLGNLIGNLDELADPDLYPDPLDKQRIALLEKFSHKDIGRIAAQLYQEKSGKSIQFSENDLVIKQALESFLTDNKLDPTPENIKLYLQDGFRILSTTFNINKIVEDSHAREGIETLQKLLLPSPEIIAIFNRLGENFNNQSGAIALSADLDFLENLIVKKEDQITGEEKELLSNYLKQIREQLSKIEAIYQTIVQRFEKIKKSVSTSNEQLTKKIGEIDKIIHGVANQEIVTTVCSNQLNTIIENMRACLSCKTRGCNNDTDLTFGESYKFYLYSRSDNNPNGSIADEIVYLVPTQIQSTGERSMSLVMDQIYGQRTSDILLNHLATLIKKMQTLKTKFPELKISILLSQNAISSAAANAELITQKLQAEYGAQITVGSPIAATVDIPASAFGDHYIEVGSGNGARTAGERQVNGYQIILN